MPPTDLPLDVALLGALPCAEGTRLRVWAPAAAHVSVEWTPPDARPGGPAPRLVDLVPEGDGYHSGMAPGIGPGTRYGYRLDDGQARPDPCSRYQPEGPHGPSMVVNPQAYAWQDGDWPGVTPHGQVIYELHIGTFTPEGTFAAAIGQLAELKALGVTMLELMPVAECPGRFNWGYDGVQLYAPYHVYGTPDDFRRFVDAAHGLGLAVILDVVYNHLGPDGNYLPNFSPHYFTDRHGNEWGQAIDFDGPHSRPVRDFFIGNACYWIREFHLDGLRLDATQAIHDAGPVHVLAELSERARAAAHPRGIFLVAENEPQAIHTIEPVAQGGHGLDAMWNDATCTIACASSAGMR